MSEAGLRELASIRERLDTLFERTLSGSGLGSSLAREPWSPPVDVAETEVAYHMTFEIPGVERADLNLHLDGRVLIVEGTRDSGGEGRRFLRMERSHGSFRREVELGSALDPDGIEAHLARGLLTVRVAKKKPRRVEIRTVGDEA